MEHERRVPLADAIRQNRERILQRWEGEARGLPRADALPSNALRDHIPELLDQIVRLLVERTKTARGALPGRYPDLHALSRLDQGYDIEQVTEEYGILRRCILRVLDEERLWVGYPELEFLDSALDESIRKSVARFTGARQRTFRALEAISAAALDAPEATAFLDKLAHTLLVNAEAVDSTTVLLLENDRLQVRATVGLESLLEASFSMRIGEGFSGRVAQERAPLMIKDATHDPIVASDAIRKRGIRALYGVPMMEGERLVGVAHMGSATTSEFSEEDKLIFRAMVNRATSLLMQSQLRQQERHSREQAGRALAETRQLHALASTLVEAVTFDKVSAAVLEVGSALLGAERGTLFLTQGEVLTVARSYHPPPEDGDDHARIPLSVSLPVTDALRSGAPLIFSRRAELLERYPSLGDHPRVERLESLVLLPLIGDRGPLGALAFSSPEVARFRDEDLGFLRAIASQCALGLERAALAGTNDLALRTLRQSEERISAIVSGAALLTWSSTPDGRRVDPQPSWSAFTGQSFEEYRELGWLDAIHPKDRERIRNEWIAHSSLPTRYETEYRLRRADGSYVWTVAYGTPLLDEDGAIREWVGMNIDVTARKQTEEFRERFLGIVSHDLRNPLSVILTSARLMERSDSLPDKLRRPATRISDSAERMARMISDLLDFTRGRLGGGIPITRQQTDLRPLVLRVVDDASAAHPEAELSFTAKPGRYQGEFDPDRIAQLAANLVDNALQHGRRGTPVEVRLDEDGGEVRLEVHNAGPPIPPEQLASVFEPFKRGGETGHSGGLGLGLFIVHEIARAHGGRVKVSSGEDGTTFTVVLPRGA